MSGTRLLPPAEARRRIPELAAVLVDCVEGGASVSFMDGFSMAEAVGFYADVAQAAEEGRVFVFAAFDDDDRLVGTVQLWPADKPNQPHRCDIAKMLVRRDARRAGRGEQLMRASEAHAKSLGKTLLTLDTQAGDAADRLYRRLGWQAIGVIPGFALWPDGRPCDTVFFYKEI